MNQMLIRFILPRIHKHRHFATLCSHENAEPSLADPGTAISSACSKDESPRKAYVVSYLVSQCGLSPEMAISASQKVHFDGPDKPNDVLNFLGKQGFSKAQIAELVVRKPDVLVSNPEKTLSPKIEFFMRFAGISKTDTLKTVSRYPSFLARCLDNRVGRMYTYLKDTIGSEKVKTLLRRGSWVFNLDLENKIIPNVEYLRALGVPDSCVELGLFHWPEIFAPNHDEFKEIVEEVKQMGFDLSKSTFVVAMHARTGKGNAASWDKCYETYRKWGWSEDDIYMAFKKHPNCMLLSERKISTVLDFLVSKVGREARLVAKCPYILFYSVEKRIVPRCSVVHFLFLKGLLQKDWSLTSALSPREDIFLDKYVKKYADKLPQLYDLYEGKASAVEA